MFTYRYTFYSNLGEFQFGANQVPNWDNLKTKLSENKYYRGVFFEYTDTLEFCSAARKYIRDLVEREGMDAELQLKIEQGNESGHDSSFVRFGTTNLVAQFNETYEMGETSCNVSFAESGFKQKVINREDSNVDYQTYTSIDGDTIEPYENETLSTYMHDRVIKFENKLSFNDAQLSAIGDISVDGITHIYYAIPVKINDASDINYQNLPFLKLDNKDDVLLKYYLNSDADRIIKQSIDVDITIRRIKTQNVSFKIYKEIVDENNKIIDSIELASETIPDELEDTGDWEYNFIYSTLNEEIDIKEGYSLRLYFDFRLNGDFVDFAILGVLLIDENKSKVFDIASNSEEKSPATTIETVPLFEAVNRNLQIITGQQNSFKSNIFGKTTNEYAEDGELAYMTLANGKMIRGFPFEDSKFNLNFKDIVKDIINQWNLVGFFSFDGENTFFNLERFADVYDLNHSVEVDVISESKVTLDSDWHFALLKYGIKNYEYEEVNGLDSFNGEFERGTPLKSTNKKLDVRLKKIRSDDYGIEFTRRKTYSTTPTEDYRSDDDNFIIDSKLAPGYPYDLRATKAEDFEEVNGIYSPDTAYNLRISAGRQLKEWYNILSPSLNYKPDNLIKFVKGAKNDNLQTKLIGEENLLVENADIQINDLGRAFILPYNIKFNCLLDFEKYNIIKKYPHKTIKFNMKDDGETFPVYVFVKELDYDINKGEATITGLRANR